MTILTRAAVVAALSLGAASGADAQASTIRVTIAGGPHAGTYELKDKCVVSDTEFPDMHIMAFAVAPGPKTPRSLEFFSASGKAKGKPDGFVVAAQFPGKERIAYEIFTIARELQPQGVAIPISGTGSATVRKTATGRTATFRGKTKDGVQMEGSVDCRNDG